MSGRTNCLVCWQDTGCTAELTGSIHEAATYQLTSVTAAEFSDLSLSRNVCGRQQSLEPSNCVLLTANPKHETEAASSYISVAVQAAPHSKHTSRLILFKAMIAACCQQQAHTGAVVR